MKISSAALVFVLLSCLGQIRGQVHKSKPLPQLSEEPVHLIDENIKGWSYSLDGQWLSREMNIPPRLISTNHEAFETHEAELGLDNIEELQLYPMLYGSDTLLALVKIYRNGNYEFEATQRGWDDYNQAYYFVFEPGELDQLKSVGSEPSIIKIKLRGFGELRQFKKRKVRSHLKDDLLVKDKTNRVLAITMKVEEGTAYFQMASLHSIFSDVEGVLHDFKRQGSSLYGSPILLDYLHYSYDFEALKNFFSVPSNITFE